MIQPRLKQLLNQLPNAWMHTGLMILGQTGSHAYGTETETSDVDYKGIAVPTPDHYFGFNPAKEYNGPSMAKQQKNKKDDIDIIIMPIAKFVKSATNGHPNDLELLFLKESDYVYLNDYGRALIDIRQHFLSKKTGHRFYGYAKSQTQKMLELKSNGEANPETIAKYGYDTKFYMHTVRLLTSAITILKTREFHVKHLQADELKALRNGKHTLAQAVENIEVLNKKLLAAHGNSQLPEEPEWEFIEKQLTRITSSFMKNEYL